MLRLIFILLLNLSLPFLLYYLRYWVWRWWLSRREPKVEILSDTPKVPPMNWPLFVKLLGLGLLLLAAVLFGMRLGADG